LRFCFTFDHPQFFDPEPGAVKYWHKPAGATIINEAEPTKKAKNV
jgi:hypothetical protein